MLIKHYKQSTFSINPYESLQQKLLYKIQLLIKKKCLSFFFSINSHKKKTVTKNYKTRWVLNDKNT